MGKGWREGGKEEQNMDGGSEKEVKGKKGEKKSWRRRKRRIRKRESVQKERSK